MDSPEAYLANAFYEAAEAEANANTRAADLNYESMRLNKIPEITPTDEEIDTFAELLEAQLDQEFRFDALSGVVADEQIAAAKEHVKSEMRRFWELARQKGLRGALASAYSIENIDADTLKKPVRLLGRTHVLRSGVRELLGELAANLDDTTKSELAEAIDLEDCLGLWLQHAVEQQLRRAFLEDEANNLFDLNHVGFLPYVDLLFCDKRIAELTRQVLRARDLPSGLAGVRPPVNVPNDVNAIAAVLREAVQGR